MKPALEPIATNARQRSQQDTRQRVLRAAATLVREHGSHKTTMKATARLAGVAVGTVYLHFKDKDALLAAVLDLALAELKRALTAPGRPRAADARADVRAKMAGLADFAAAEPELAAMLFDPVLLDGPAGVSAREFLEQSQLRGLQSGREKGWYRADLDDALTARALVGALTRVLGDWARRPGSATREQVVDVLTALRLEGLAARR